MARIEEGSGTWSIVLAGGDGERIKPFIRHWLGEGVPKQYCTFVGRRSMLQHTIDRADRVAAPERRVTVVGRGHRRWAREQLRGDRGRLVVQPSNRDTAPGIFLPLAHVMAEDPEATVVVFPSDHFIHPEDRFVATVRDMARIAGSLEDRLVLLGAKPNSVEREYGWIEPGPLLGITDERVRCVKGFLEKPGPAAARQAFARGALWNTLVFAVKARTLWAMGRRCFPEMMVLFDLLADEIGGPGEKVLTEAIYREIDAANFSRDLLEKLGDETLTLALEGAEWSDWGRPERIVESLDRIGRRPTFDPRLLAPPLNAALNAA